MIFKELNVTACDPMLFLKRSEFFGVCHDMQKIKFLKFIHKKEFSWKETNDIDLRFHI